MKRMFLGLLLFFSASVLWAQVTQEWVARYDGAGNATDYPTALALDDSGNVYVTGRTQVSVYNYDYATIKYNSVGETLWVRRYNGPGEGLDSTDEATALAVDVHGGVCVTGRSWGTGTGYDYATLRYDGNGDTLWVRRYNGPHNEWDRPVALVIDASANVYVTGSSESDFLTIKYRSNGDTAWVRRCDIPTDRGDQPKAIGVDDSGCVYITGLSWNSGTRYDYATVKYDSGGNLLWTALYDGPGSGGDAALALALDSSGNLYITGYSEGSGTNYDYATVKHDGATGETLWVRRYNGPGNGYDVATALDVDPSGNVYITGRSEGNGTWYDYTTIKYDSNGNLLWIRRYDGPATGADRANALALDDSGSVYVTGESQGNLLDHDYATVKYDSNGNPLWVMRYHGGRWDDRAYAIGVDGEYNVYVTGESAGDVSQDYATIKYSQSVGVGEYGNPELEAPCFQLYVCQPNPVVGIATIRYAIPEGEDVHVDLAVYDITGRLVETLVGHDQRPGSHSVRWDAEDKASGVYFYKLQARDFTDTKKMLLLR